MRKKFGPLFVLFSINLGGLLGGIVLLELALGNWFVPYVVPDPRMMNISYTFRQTVYRPFGELIYSRDQYGLRGLQVPISAIELVTVGGSTTDQTLIPDGQTWQDTIHAATGIKVANAGVNGMGSQSHPVVVDEWLHRIPGLRAGYYLHYLGVNDALMSQTVPIADQARNYAWSRRIRGRSAILHGLARLRQWNSGPILVNHAVMTPSDNAEPVMAAADRGEIVEYVEQMYKPNLRTLLDLHSRRRETAILVSQPANPAMVVRENGAVLVQQSDIGRWAIALEAVNQATAAVCAEKPDICRFIDVARRLKFEPEDFYDLVHNTPQGARKLGVFLAAELDSIRLSATRR